MAKVYGSCHHPDPANELAAALRAAGHEVTSAWHTVAEPRPAADDPAGWAPKAAANFAAICRSECLVVVAGPEGGRAADSYGCVGRCEVGAGPLPPRSRAQRASWATRLTTNWVSSEGSGWLQSADHAVDVVRVTVALKLAAE